MVKFTLSSENSAIRTLVKMRNQTKILKGTLAVALFTFNVVGLWPFRLSNCKRKIEYSSIKATYSILIFLFGTVSYQIVGSMMFNGSSELFFGSFTLRLILMLYSQSVWISFIFAYLSQHWFANEIQNVYAKCVDIVDTMNNSSFRDIDLSIYFFEMTMRSIITDIVQVVVFSYIFSSTGTQTYVTFILVFPSLAVRLHMNVFYGIVLAINVYISKLNCRLAEILAKVTYDTRHKHLKMVNYCYCSDELDKLTALYVKLAQATKSINSIFSIHLALWNATIVLTLTLRFFALTISIIEIILNRSEVAFMLNLNGCIFTVVILFDLFSMSYACQRINNSVIQLRFK